MTKKIIGLYQLITGIFGVIIILANYISKDFSSVILTQIFVGTILYGLLAWIGYGLLNNMKNSLKYSRMIQALQIVSFTIGGTMYKFTAAAFIGVGFENGEFSSSFNVQAVDFAMTYVSGDDFRIVIYIIPIIMLYSLLKQPD